MYVIAELNQQGAHFSLQFSAEGSREQLQRYVLFLI